MATADVEAVDFEPEEDDLMDEDGARDADTLPRAAIPKLRSAITGGGDDSSAMKKTKGRGFREESNAECQRRLSSCDFESLGFDGGPGPQRFHEEAQEDDLQNVLGEFGEIKNLHLNLDRRTWFVKGYALIECEKFEEAKNAIAHMNGAELLTLTINVGWAFRNGPYRKKHSRSGRTHRSRSPRIRY